MKRLHRRKFLQLGAGAIGLGIAPAIAGCGDETSGNDGTLPPPPPSTYPLVSAAQGTDLVSMTHRALDLLGGIESVVKPGESVFIKPNMVTLPFAPYGSQPIASGECTKPEIVVAVAEACLVAGASEVIIGDGSQTPNFSWGYALYLDASTDLFTEVARLNAEYDSPVRLACLELESPEWIELPTSTTMGTIAVSSLVTSADRIISIPVAKTHAWAQLSLSLKNFIGITPLAQYAEDLGGWWDRGKGLDHTSPQALAQIYLDIVAALRPDLALVDFSIGVEGDGPTVGADSGQTVDMRDRLGSWLLLASKDLVAADATAARVMSHDPTTIHQLTMAHEMGLGELDLDAFEIGGASLDDLRVAWQPAVLRNLGKSRHKRGCPYSLGRREP